MRQVHTNHLNSQQLGQIKELVECCQAHDSFCLSFACEEGDSFFLLYDGSALICALYLFFPEPRLCECGAFTLPSRRNRGCFTRLLGAALTEIAEREKQVPEGISLYFPADPRCRDASLVLEALEAEYWYSEYMMEKSLDVLCPPDAVEKWPVRIERVSPEVFLFQLSRPLPGLDGPLGSCRLSVRGLSAYFYGFQIEEALRRRGIGSACLSRLLSFLSEQGVRTVSLQVSGQNLPALSLYKKAGFRIAETLSYYWY